MVTISLYWLMGYHVFAKIHKVVNFSVFWESFSLLKGDIRQGALIFPAFICAVNDVLTWSCKQEGSAKYLKDDEW